jgi:Lrp/AsnC family transcriptional regulator, regulator for asnA, asnC and gidA
MNGKQPGHLDGGSNGDGRWGARNGDSVPEKLLASPARVHEPDLLDRQIIHLLQADGRCSNREIARQLNVPEATIRYRVRRLTDSGLLKITALVAPEHLGYQMTVVISIQVQAERINDVADMVGAMPEVMWLAVTSGSSDIILTASFQNQEHLYSFLTEKLAPVPGIVRSETAIGLRIVKRDVEWAFDLTTEISSLPEPTPVPVG